MNKIFNINLGGYPFTVDEDAYEHLSNYLKTIHSHFGASEGYEEITTDIESRMAELIFERLTNREIVNIKDVEATISILGTPEDFGAEPLVDEEPSFFDDSSIKTGKRLFRNSEDKVVAGVCSGITAYFGFKDPIWVRLLFIIGAFSGGLSIVLYALLWFIIKEADSAADRLAMKGQPINVSNIAKTIEEEVTNFGAKLADLSTSSKKKLKVEKDLFDAPFRKGFHC